MKTFLLGLADLMPTFVNIWLIYRLWAQGQRNIAFNKLWRPVAKVISYEDGGIIRVGTGENGMPPPGSLLYVRDVEKPV